MMRGLADRMRGVLKQLRALVRKDSVEQEMDEEMAFHLEMEIDRRVREGVTHADARRAALVAFGGVERHKMGVREARWTRVFEDAAMDVRYAVRSLRRNPALLVIAVVTLGIGVGATTVVFTLTRAVLFPELSVSRNEQLVTINERRTGRTSTIAGQMRLPSDRVHEYGAAARTVLSGVAGYTFGAFSLSGAGGARSIAGSLTTGNYFEVLGLRPALGAFYARDDEALVVLAYDLWRVAFGGDRQVIGTTIRIDSREFRVVGVAPREFRGTFNGIAIDAWFPVKGYGAGVRASTAAAWLIPFGRLAQGVSLDAANSVVNDIAQRIPPAESHTRVRGARLERLTGVPSGVRGPAAGFFAMLMSTAGLVLLIASANIAGLLLARAIARRREIGLRLALGAARTRLIRQLVTEALVLFLAGAAAGMLVTFVAASFLERISLPIPFRISLDLSPDLRVFGFGLLIAALTGLMFGLIPALHASRADLVTMIKDAGAVAQTRRSGIRNTFVAAQLAMAIVLLIVTGLFARTLQNSLRQELGFDPDNVVVATFNLSKHGYDEARGRTFQRHVLDQLRALPGVEAAGLSTATLLSGSEDSNDANAVDPGASGIVHASIPYTHVDAGYFEALRVPLVAGRFFTDREGAGGLPPAVINEHMAARFWPNERAIGKRFRTANTTYEVVGVTRNGVYARPDEDPVSFMFLPNTHEYSGTMTLHVNTSARAAETITQIRRIVAERDSDIALETTGPLNAVIGLTLFPQRFAAILIGVFGLAGMLLAVVGVYGVIASYVAQRYREFGIRVALGAQPAAVAMLVLKRGALLTLAGAVAGLVLAALATRFLRSLVFNVSTLDPLTFVAATLILCLAALAASYLPARRAAGLDPLAAINGQ